MPTVEAARYLVSQFVFLSFYVPPPPPRPHTSSYMKNCNAEVFQTERAEEETCGVRHNLRQKRLKETIRLYIDCTLEITASPGSVSQFPL